MIGRRGSGPSNSMGYALVVESLCNPRRQTDHLCIRNPYYSKERAGGLSLRNSRGRGALMLRIESRAPWPRGPQMNKRIMPFIIVGAEYIVQIARPQLSFARFHLLLI